MKVVEYRAYKSWQGMRDRCLNPRNSKYPRYGGRGIKICERWNVFKNFLADMGERPAGTSIDRIDNDGNYEPSNCRWATPIQQVRNRSMARFVEVKGERLNLSAAAERYGISIGTIWRRLKLGWTEERAVLAPLHSVSKREAALAWRAKRIA